MTSMEEFKNQFVRNELKITENYGKILSILDFGNINHWFEDDRQDADHKVLDEDQKLKISLDGLKNFASIFSKDIRFYYGTDSNREGSVNFISAVKHVFGRSRVFSKQIQYVRHYLKGNEFVTNTRQTFLDFAGTFVRIPKCNFDVEISVDTIRLIDQYDTLAMFSGDADFIALFRHLKNKGKRIVLIKGGNISTDLRRSADLVVSAQNIKKYISSVEKQKPGV
jgi:hypothetical protein